MSYCLGVNYFYNSWDKLHVKMSLGIKTCNGMSENMVRYSNVGVLRHVINWVDEILQRGLDVFLRKPILEWIMCFGTSAIKRKTTDWKNTTSYQTNDENVKKCRAIGIETSNCPNINTKLKVVNPEVDSYTKDTSDTQWQINTVKCLLNDNWNKYEK